MNPEYEIHGEDFLDFKCPYCGSLNSFPTSAAGLVRECLNCLETFLVPDTDGGAARQLPLPVETPTIRIRRFEPTDWEDLLEFQFDDEDDATGWLLELSKARITETRQPFYFAVEVKETEKVVGSLGLRFTDSAFNQVEFSLVCKKPAPVEGLELEAVKAALGFCFQDLRVHRVFAQCVDSDAESRELFAKAGMRQEAEFVKNKWTDEGWQTTFWFAMLDEEFGDSAG